MPGLRGFFLHLEDILIHLEAPLSNIRAILRLLEAHVEAILGLAWDPGGVAGPGIYFSKINAGSVGVFVGHLGPS